jgi:hypothetical protein
VSANTTRRRVARKWRHCASGHPIAPGQVYLEHKSFPGSDDGWGDAAGHPVRMAECADCATRYGRADALAVIS